MIQQDQSWMEQQWVEAARGGDKGAFSRLVQAYQRPVYNLTYRMLGSSEEAEDAAQETFLRAYSRLGQYDPQMKFSTWVFSIANHHCIDRLRKRRATHISIDDNPVLENLVEATPQPEHQALEREQGAELQTLISQLDPDYRTPLVLRYWEELSYEEIAQSMGVTVAAVKSRLFRARQQLMALYERNQGATAPPSGPRKAATSSNPTAARHDRTLHVRLGLAGV
jgi:RNA polymerase sigma-70 factor (ECF subfamily)